MQHLLDRVDEVWEVFANTPKNLIVQPLAWLHGQLTQAARGLL